MRNVNKAGQWRRRLGPTIVAVALAGAACGGGSDPASDAIHVVATTTILGDVARNVVGSAGTVDVLLPIGADPHDYQPSARQVAQIQEADLVLSNGLHLEEGLVDVLETAAADGAVVLEVAPELDPIPFAGDDSHEEASLDPHVWLDPIRMAEAAVLVSTALETAAPGGGWAARALEYADQLQAAHEQIESILAVVPTGQRKLVTNHDSLGYFADRYGFEIVGAVIPGGATLANPSSAQLAALVQTIREEEVPAIFAETTDTLDLAEAIAAEFPAGLEIVSLYTGSLGSADEGADTLIGMLIGNARRIAQALQ